MKKVLVIVASPRKGGNSDSLADAAIESILKSGAGAEKIYVSDLNIIPCKGCLRCNVLGRCAIDDDFTSFVKKFTEADSVVISSPVYFYNIPGTLKSLIDRFRSVMRVTVLPNNLVCEPTIKGGRNFLVILVQGEPVRPDYKGAYRMLSGFAKNVAGAKKILLLAAKGLQMKGQVNMDKDALKSLFVKLSLPDDDKFVSRRLRHNRGLLQKAGRLAEQLVYSR